MARMFWLQDQAEEECQMYGVLRTISWLYGIWTVAPLGPYLASR